MPRLPSRVRPIASGPKNTSLGLRKWTRSTIPNLGPREVACHGSLMTTAQRNAIIRKSKKTTRELADQFGMIPHSIRRIQRYKTDEDMWSYDRELARKVRVTNPEIDRNRIRKWRAANPEKQKKQYRRQFDSNPEKHRERCRQWRANNPEKHKATVRRYQIAHPDTLGVIRARRRARLAQCHPGDEKGLRFIAWVKSRQLRCYWCGEFCTIATIDHLYPCASKTATKTARKLGNKLINLQCCCGSCNSSKGAKTAAEYSRVLRRAGLAPAFDTSAKDAFLAAYEARTTSPSSLPTTAGAACP